MMEDVLRINGYSAESLLRLTLFIDFMMTQKDISIPDSILSG